MAATWTFFLATTQTQARSHSHIHSEHTRADQLGHYNRSGSSKSVSHETQLSIITLSQLSIKPNCLTAAPGPSPELRQTLTRMVRTLSFLSSPSLATHTLVDSRTVPVLKPSRELLCVCFCDCITRPPVRVYPSEYLSNCMCVCMCVGFHL